MNGDVGEALDGELLLPVAPAQRHLSTAEENELARRIRDEQAAGERSLKDAVKHFRRCGEILLKAKADLGHGQFAHFLKHSAKVHPRSAQRYIRLAKSLAALPAAEATRVSQLSLRDAMGELSRTSNRAAKLPPPALKKALTEARREPLKSAVIKAANEERRDTLPAAVYISPGALTPREPPPIEIDDCEDGGLATPAEVAAMQARLDAILGQAPSSPAPSRPRSDKQMTGDIIDFLCRVPVDRHAPVDAAEIADPKMAEAIDRYFDRAIPWIANFADAWRSRDDARVDDGADDDLVSGIVGHIWAAKHQRPEITDDEIRASLNSILKMLARGLFGAGADQ